MDDRKTTTISRIFPDQQIAFQDSTFQTFTKTPAATPSTLVFGITHQPHEGGDGAKCGAKFADTFHVIYTEVTGVRSE